MDSLANKFPGSQIGNLSQSSAYTDFSALAELRAKATSSEKSESDEATAEVAKQFESVFLQMMLKSMRDATYTDDNNESDQMRFYQDMFDKQIAMDLSNRENGGIGLAKIMQQQLSGITGTSSVDKTAEPVVLKPFDIEALRRVGAKPHSFNFVDAETVKTSSQLPSWSPKNPEEFIRDVLPHAKKAAEKLGVDASILVAQSALETGWGQKMIKHSNGSNANNLFGIKADSRWHGDKATVSTLEYRDGIAAKEKASFRSYDSIAESFDDYVAFIQNSPRYQKALSHATDGQAYLNNLQQAGYSTDPIYAQKIQTIAEGIK